MVADGQVSVGVVPIPGPAEEEPWWLSFASEAENLPRVVARLPFLSHELSGTRGEPLEAFVIAARSHEKTGDDRSLFAVETAPDVSRDRLRQSLESAGIELTVVVAIWRGEDSWLHLIEANGHITQDDPRLEDLISTREPFRRATVLGGYARPITA
jgi:chorismate mutase/prephenate dehydratase